MKAAVLHQLGTVPVFEDFPDPQVVPGKQLLIRCKAASIKQLDRLKASGKHYTTYATMPTAVGVDGVGILDDGTRVYANGITGMLAEKALIDADNYVVIPDGISNAIAAALPNALLGSDAALLYRGQIKKNDVVLIQGATGVTGKLAVQMAKYRGASKVIATGRNQTVLEELRKLGADEIVNLKGTDIEVIEQLKNLYQQHAFDLVIDYLWGKPMEILLKVLQELHAKPIRVVTVGEMAGATINLPSGILRSTAIALLGSGIGSISKEEIQTYFKKELPLILKYAAQGNLVFEIETRPLSEIEHYWDAELEPGKRLVIEI